MRSISIAIATAALAATVYAAPHQSYSDVTSTSEWKDEGKGKACKNHAKPKDNKPFCLTAEQGAAGADIFRQLITGYTEEFALETLTEDFIDYSSAVNIIRNRGNAGPFIVNAITFDSRAAFMAGHGSQPSIPFDTLNTWHGCDTVSIRWQTLRSGIGQETESNNIPVVGTGILVMIPDTENSFGFRVSELYSEFNSAAWLVNNGVFTPEPVVTSNFPEATVGPQRRNAPGLEWAGI